MVDGFLGMHGIYERLPLSRERLEEYLGRISATYAPLPYHSMQHILSVVQTSIDLWSSTGLGGIVTRSMPKDRDVLLLAYIIAAAVHDAGHVGLTNDFLIRTNHPYAITYNDVSPNESHHAATAFQILLDDCNFCDFPPERFHLFRQTVIALVLCTDMSKHHTIVSNLRSRDFRDPGAAEIPILMQAAIKCADLGHVFMNFDDHRAWSLRLQQELFMEGDRWKQHSWTPPSLMDRAASGDFPSSQVGFFRYIVIPFAEALAAVLPCSEPLLRAARDNAARWQES